GTDSQSLGILAVYVGACRPDDRLLDFLHAADAERRQQGAVVWQEQGEIVVQLAKEGDVQGCRRGGRGKRGAAGDYRVPQGTPEIPEAWRPDSEGRSADGTAWDRQDASRPCGCGRSERAVLLDQRLRFRGDVCRRRRLPRPRPLRAG